MRWPPGCTGTGSMSLAELHFKHKMISYDDVTGSGKNKITFDRVPLDKATDYAAEDADFTLAPLASAQAADRAAACDARL